MRPQHNMNTVDATISSLWRYPVKSLLGERLEKIAFDHRGVVNDRIFAISNKAGKIGSGKNTRRFTRLDGLFSMSAKCDETGVSITFPDGVILNDRSNALDAKLSESLGEQVTLRKEQAVSHLDAGAVHIITQQSLVILQEKLPKYKIDERRFRPNIVLDIANNMADEALIGKTIYIADVMLEVMQLTERCRMITLEQQALSNAPAILKTISKEFALNFGVYARVKHVGSIGINDKVRIE